MNNNPCVRLPFFQSGYAPHVIQVRVRAGDRLELKPVIVDGAHNLV
jgi:hypothetical protein